MSNALESITTNRASGGDGILVERFQILKDDAVKVLHSICQQIWKTQCVETSLVLLEEGVCYDQCVLLAKLY